jgi:hypothetical protein
MCTTRTDQVDTISPELREQIMARAQEIADSSPELTGSQREVLRRAFQG